MCCSQIGNVNEVAHGRTVRGWEVAAMYHQLARVVESRFDHKRDQMRFRIMALAQFTIHVSTGSVEVAEANRAQLMRLLVPVTGFLHKQLRFAIGVYR